MTGTILIDGVSYNANIISLEETVNFLDKFAERTVDGNLRRELIGTFPQQRLVFGQPRNASERSDYASLWAKLSEAEEFHTVTVPDTDGVDFTFTAYFSNVTRKLRKWDSSATYWKQMTVNFTAKGPKATP